MTDCRFPKKLESPDMLCELSSPVAEATDWVEVGQWVIGVSVKVWLVSHQQLQRKSAALWVVAVLWVPPGSDELVE